MREHTNLPAMVGLVSNHVAQHLRANRPGPSPAVSAKHLDASTTAERITKHLPTASGALGQPRTNLLRRTVRAVQQQWDLQVRSRKPDPFAADIVHVREDRRNAADVAGRLGSPCSRVKVFDKSLVHPIIGSKDLDCSPTELIVNLVLARGHGSCSSTYPTSGCSFYAVILPLSVVECGSTPVFVVTRSTTFGLSR